MAAFLCDSARTWPVMAYVSACGSGGSRHNGGSGGGSAAAAAAAAAAGVGCGSGSSGGMQVHFKNMIVGWWLLNVCVGEATGRHGCATLVEMYAKVGACVVSPRAMVDNYTTSVPAQKNIQNAFALATPRTSSTGFVSRNQQQAAHACPVVYFEKMAMGSLQNCYVNTWAQYYFSYSTTLLV